MASDGPADEPKSERFNMFISKSEMEAIDQWAWKNRIRSKSEAVRRLVQLGSRLEPELQSIFDLITFQLNQHKDLDQIIDKLNDIWVDSDPTETSDRKEARLAIITIDLMDWAAEAWRATAELHDQTLTLVSQNNAFGGPEIFADAVKLADEARAEGERRRALWKARLEGLKKSEGD